MPHSSPPQITLVDATMTVSTHQKFPKSKSTISGNQEKTRLFKLVDKLHVRIFSEIIMNPDVQMTEKR